MFLSRLNFATNFPLNIVTIFVSSLETAGIHLDTNRLIREELVPAEILVAALALLLPAELNLHNAAEDEFTPIIHNFEKDDTCKNKRDRSVSYITK